MPNYVRRVDGVDDVLAEHINELQFGIEELANSNKRLPADVTTSATAGVDVTGMSVAMAANEVWTVEWFFQNGCSGTGGVKWAITAPTGCTFRAVADGMASGITIRTHSILTTSGALTGSIFNAIASPSGFTRITATFVNGATDGLAQVRVASVTNGQVTTVFANSYQNARRLF